MLLRRSFPHRHSGGPSVLLDAVGQSVDDGFAVVLQNDLVIPEIPKVLKYRSMFWNTYLDLATLVDLLGSCMASGHPVVVSDMQRIVTSRDSP